MEYITQRDSIFIDERIKSKFASFRDGISEINSFLFHKDNVFYLLLCPYGELFLKKEICLKASSPQELFDVIDNITSNLGMILIDEQSKNIIDVECWNLIMIDGIERRLVSLQNLRLVNEDESRPLYSNQELTFKLKERFGTIFGSKRNDLISAYIYNSIFTRINGKYILEEYDYSIIKKYKKQWYQFVNSFLSYSNMKSDDLFSFDLIDRGFINDLYCLYDMFEKFPALEEDIVVFRGVPEQNPIELRYDSFISTSLDVNVASSFASDLLYEIVLPKGTRFIPVDSIGDLSSMYGEPEAEILLRPGNLQMIESGTRGRKKLLKVLYQERDDFSDVIISVLELRKNDIIEHGLCSFEGYVRTLDYAKEKAESKHKQKVKVK